MRKLLPLLALALACSSLAHADVPGITPIGAYPAGVTPETASATGTIAATSATLAASAGVTTYICGFSIRANASASSQGFATVTGIISGTLSFLESVPSGAGSVASILEPSFTPCVPATAPNTPIIVNSIAPGTGGLVSVTAWGYTR